MIHPLAEEYGLTATELLDAINRRFRAKVTLEGAVAEVQLGKQIKALVSRGVLARFDEHDQDGYPDYTIWQPDQERPLLVECKNVRDSDEAYRAKGDAVAYKVETQKTRTSKGDRSSRFYEAGHFDILAVCLGKKTHNWSEFVFIRSGALDRHKQHPGKLAVMHRVPLPGRVMAPWCSTLEELLRT
ncbi:hypothetical protein HZA57_10075 [Candidatus Poribacteria bacterium]|nr:hypothetical protein [Candidatus Poribacteria bacterium]